MKEYKIIGYSWSKAERLGNVYGDGYSAEKYSSPAASYDLNEYAEDGWRVVDTWRNDQGVVWFVLER